MKNRILLKTMCIVLIVLSVGVIAGTLYLINSSANNQYEISMATPIPQAIEVTATPTPIQSDNNSEITAEIPEIQPTSTPEADKYAVIEMIEAGDAETLGFDLDKLNKVGTIIQNDVEADFPGAEVIVVKDGYIAYHETFGYIKMYEQMEYMDEPCVMEDNTLFDLKSLSKVYGTMLAIMKLEDEGFIKTEDYISTYLDGFDNAGKQDITIELLLRHRSGYRKLDVPFYNSESSYYSTDRDTTIQMLSDIPLDDEPGGSPKYSNINYMILGAIVEEVSGVNIDEYTYSHIYEPLGIGNQLMYNPLEKDYPQEKIAATARMGNTSDMLISYEGIRDYTLQGETYEPNAYYSFDGIAGHAGLFATPMGLSILNQMLLNKGEYNGTRIYSIETAEKILSITDGQKYQYCLWNARKVDTIADHVSKHTFHHTGGTGTATIIDVDNNMSIILCTNKLHTPSEGTNYKGMYYNTGLYYEIINQVYKALK